MSNNFSIVTVSISECSDDKNIQEQIDFIKAVTQGLLEINKGKEQSLDDVKTKLGI